MAYDYSHSTKNSTIYLKFDQNDIDEIKFEYIKDKQKFFGVIEYEDDLINITLNTNQISFDELKKFLPKPQNNQKLKRKDNFTGKFKCKCLQSLYHSVFR